ncbi:MAG: NADH:ubiquinone reductase (Na(+)-transporting) subunit C [Alistipes sp.]|nr:NADH:ubiquinone reductase (Na(+)-transporting) subunit C [Rikenellaceae bacterium]MBO5045220.1 NADH:ubiquinone reductase (Na(+)-transporting) subunit C [Alistipes sp.]MBP3602314.1 NADH:ubiquinone reductase (Na(+)-transporting) subunit C [Alistipes sp.]MBQ7787697.1 NADH:ubiquinone reductase (Na(+)-transporting) subunit C [Alistipes sp.]
MAKFNVNSNAYIIVYSVVMVVIVAVLLAVTSLSLQERQGENILNEKKQQIVKALGENPATAAYGDVVAEAVMLDKNGNKIEGKNDADIFNALGDLTASFEAGEFPLFKAANGSVVIPVYGAGLWGPVWGYIALEPDMNTVKGIVMDHSGETPGLGAEITTDKVQSSFVGKTIFEGNDFVSVSMRKGGATNNHEVDAISGGTKTCDGVNAMLKDGLQGYLPYINANKSNK